MKEQIFSVWDTCFCIKLWSGLTVTSMKDLIMAYPQANSEQQVWISWSSVMNLITDVTCHRTYSTLKNTANCHEWSRISLICILLPLMVTFMSERLNITYKQKIKYLQKYKKVRTYSNFDTGFFFTAVQPHDIMQYRYFCAYDSFGINCV